MTDSRKTRNVYRSISPSLMKGASAAIAVLTLILGTLLPVLTGPTVSRALVNVVWGSVHGLGFLLTSLFPAVTPGALNFLITLFGMLIWPLLATYGIYRGTEAVLRRRSTALSTICALVFLGSIVWNVPIGEVRKSFVYYLPLYTAFMDR